MLLLLLLSHFWLGLQESANAAAAGGGDSVWSCHSAAVWMAHNCCVLISL
jgi:hypothetical protein